MFNIQFIAKVFHSRLTIGSSWSVNGKLWAVPNKKHSHEFYSLFGADPQNLYLFINTDKCIYEMDIKCILSRRKREFWEFCKSRHLDSSWFPRDVETIFRKAGALTEAFQIWSQMSRGWTVSAGSTQEIIPGFRIHLESMKLGSVKLHITPWGLGKTDGLGRRIASILGLTKQR